MIDIEKYITAFDDGTLSLSHLDDLVISHKTIPAYKNLMRFSITVELYFDNGWLPEVRSSTVDVMESYYDLFPEYIHKFWKPGARKYLDIKNKNFIRYNRMMVDNHDMEKSFGGMIEGTSLVPNCFHCSFNTSQKWSDAEYQIPMSFIQLNFPITWVLQDVEKFIQILLSYCNKIHPAHGIVGISPIFEWGRQTDFPDYYFPFIKRFPGLDFIGSSWGVKVKDERKIRGVNWLTIIDQNYCETIAKQKHNFGEFTNEIKIHNFNKGILIQAGSEPVIGDINNDSWPIHYRTVNSVLKSIRFENFKMPYFDVPTKSALDELDETMKWIKRFDTEEENNE